MKVNFTAWAIKTNSKEGHGFLGRYWWFDDVPPVIPVHLEGCRTALFKTRAVAREQLQREKAESYVAFPDATVVKVRVTISEE